MRTAIAALRDDRLLRLNDLHDDFDHTRKLWKLQRVRVERYAERVTFHNEQTGTRITGEQLVARTGAALRRINEQTFKEIVGQFELFATDLLRLWLPAHVHLVEGKAVDVQTLFASNSLDDVRRAALQEAVDATIQKNAYARPAKWFRYLHDVFGSVVVPASDVEAFAEMKATRDLLEHSGAVANATYREKSGAAARFQVGDAVAVDDEYHAKAFQLVRRMIGDLAAAAIAVS
jgi:hypothetical protein